MCGANMGRDVFAKALVAELEHAAKLDHINIEIHVTQAVVASEIDAAVLMTPEHLKPPDTLWSVIQKQAIRGRILETVFSPREEIFNFATKAITIERRNAKCLLLHERLVERRVHVKVLRPCCQGQNGAQRCESEPRLDKGPLFKSAGIHAGSGGFCLGSICPSASSCNSDLPLPSRLNLETISVARTAHFDVDISPSARKGEMSRKVDLMKRPNSSLVLVAVAFLVLPVYRGVSVGQE